MNAWFRLYSEFATDPKVQSMPEVFQRRLVMLFCLRCADALQTLRECDIAFALRISGEELGATKQLFLANGFIDENWNLLNWDRRQFLGPLSGAERVRRHREKKRGNDVTNSNVTPVTSRYTVTLPSVSVSGSVSEQKSEEPENTSLARANGLFWEADESYRRFAGLARRFWPLILPEELARGHSRFWVRFKIAEKLLATSNMEDRIAAGEDSEFVKHMPDYLDIEWKRGPRLRANGTEPISPPKPTICPVCNLKPCVCFERHLAREAASGAG